MKLLSEVFNVGVFKKSKNWQLQFARSSGSFLVILKLGIGFYSGMGEFHKLWPNKVMRYGSKWDVISIDYVDSNIFTFKKTFVIIRLSFQLNHFKKALYQHLIWLQLELCYSIYVTSKWVGETDKTFFFIKSSWIFSIF